MAWASTMSTIVKQFSGCQAVQGPINHCPCTGCLLNIANADLQLQKTRGAYSEEYSSRRQNDLSNRPQDICREVCQAHERDFLECWVICCLSEGCTISCFTQCNPSGASHKICFGSGLLLCNLTGLTTFLCHSFNLSCSICNT